MGLRDIGRDKPLSVGVRRIEMVVLGVPVGKVNLSTRPGPATAEPPHEVERERETNVDLPDAAGRR